jgi:hypothetical protein
MPKWFVLSPAPVEKGRRTLVWRVTTLGGGHLGFVEWYSPWRCYAFHPAAETLFEKTCLRDMADFCEKATADHMARVRAAKATEGGR